MSALAYYVLLFLVCFLLGYGPVHDWINRDRP